MNITFQNSTNRTGKSNGNPAEYLDAERMSRGRTHTSGSAAAAHNLYKGVEVNFLAGREIPNGLPGAREDFRKASTLAEMQQQASMMDVGVSQDYMIVMSHTMSEEDYAKLSEEGFHFASMEPGEAVTIVDKIKAELARSGQQIIGYTDDLDMETLAAALGSDSLARQVAAAFGQADLPLTEENISAVRMAWDMVSGLETPTEGTYQYMTDNEMEPEIWNFYLAGNSGAAEGTLAKTSEFLTDENMIRQIDRMLEQSGYEVNEENRETANWLLERELPLTPDNIERLQRLQMVEFPVSEELFASSAADAVAAGKDPVYADLSQDNQNLYRQAAELLEHFQGEYGEWEQDAQSEASVLAESGNPEDVTARRQLEEIRLRMTAEVNVQLLKSGFSIDTEPLERLVEALREAESLLAQKYFPAAPDAVAKYENWNETNRVMENLPGMPARILGMTVTEDVLVSVAQVYEEGKVWKQTYQRAGESYEALMTVPRADLGDSIRKAFSNVDDILRELGMEPTEQNERAVRILGYNHMEIDEESIQRVIEADEEVRKVVEKMTPAATLRMIRDGVNPLEKSFAELSDYFDSLPGDYQEQAETYSRYLYGLENNKQITPQERDSYIGVYRLLHQIEKNDGAAIGAVVNTQAELRFSNLLSAVRSGKFRHMDVKASDEFGMLQELVKKGEQLSISEQIAGGYDRQQLEILREVATVDAGAGAMLERGQVTPSAENLLAAQGLLQETVVPFQTLREKEERHKMLWGVSGAELSAEGAATAGSLEDEALSAEQSLGEIAAEETVFGMATATNLWEQMSQKDVFRENYQSMVTGLQEDVDTYTLYEAESSLDVRALQMAHRQLSIMGQLARSEEYILPMYVGEELSAVHLTLESGGAEKGKISIRVNWEQDACMEAHLQVKEGRIEGFLVGNTEAEVTKLQSAADIFYDLIQENSSTELETAELPVVSRGNVNMTRMSGNNSRESVETPDNGTLYTVAKLFLQAIR